MKMWFRCSWMCSHLFTVFVSVLFFIIVYILSCVCMCVHVPHIHSRTQVVHGDSLVSRSTRRTVSSVMDTSFLFFSILLTAATALHPSLSPQSLSLPLAFSSFFVSAQVTPVILHWDINSSAEQHFFFPLSFYLSPLVLVLLHRNILYVCIFGHLSMNVSWTHSWCVSQSCASQSFHTI